MSSVSYTGTDIKWSKHSFKRLLLKWNTNIDEFEFENNHDYKYFILILIAYLPKGVCTASTAKKRTQSTDFY